MHDPGMKRTLAVVVVLLVACRAPRGKIRMVQRTPGGGVMALRGDHDAAMVKARTEMATQCGASAFTITQEGEEDIGVSVSMNRRSARTDTEWRVHYACATTRPLE